MAWRNPFAAREPTIDPERGNVMMEPPTYAMPQHGSFSVPPIEEGSPYNDEFGWGPHLRTSTTDIPDARRLQTIPLYQYRPNAVRPPEEFWDRLDADDAQRHSVEDIDANGWDEKKGVLPTDKRWADNPRRYPPPENRVTQRMAPRTYSFTRPFDQHAARQLNGMHFSMADHRRNYEILGMAPVRQSRNTYRLEPVPWDVDIVDMPPNRNPTAVQATITSMEVPGASRSYRLG